MKNFGVIAVLVVAFGLGGCGGKVAYVDPPKKPAKLDSSKSYAMNVLQSTTSGGLATLDSPYGGMTKPHRGIKDEQITDALVQEARHVEVPKTGLDGSDLRDIGVDLAVASAFNPGWSSTKLTSGGPTNVESLGVMAGLMLLQNLGQSRYQNAYIDNGVLYFAWIPKRQMSKEEAFKWFKQSLLDAHKKAVAEFDLMAPYDLGDAKKHVLEGKEMAAFIEVTGGMCNLDSVLCRFGTSHVMDVHSVVSPEFIGGEDAWLLVTGGLEPVFEQSYSSEKKPDNYRKPRFETATFYQEVAKHLDNELFLLVPGKNPYFDMAARTEDGALVPTLRPVLVKNGEVFPFQLPPEEVTALKQKAEKDGKFLGVF